MDHPYILRRRNRSLYDRRLPSGVDAQAEEVATVSPPSISPHSTTAHPPRFFAIVFDSYAKHLALRGVLVMKALYGSSDKGCRELLRKLSATMHVPLPVPFPPGPIVSCAAGSAIPRTCVGRPCRALSDKMDVCRSSHLILRTFVDGRLRCQSARGSRPCLYIRFSGMVRRCMY